MSDNPADNPSDPSEEPSSITPPQEVGVPGDLHAPLKINIRTRLSVMMFLQYFAWGSWFVTLSSFIGSNTGEKGESYFSEGFTGYAYGTAAIAGMISPFFVGMIADRFFSTQKILGVLHLLGAGILYYLSTVQDQSRFYITLLAFFLCYMPTLALTNSLSFHHLTNPGKQFPGIRVLGTIGWIVAGLLIGALKFNGTSLGLEDGESIEPTVIPMYFGAAAGAILGLFCFFLPKTPPSNPEGKVTFGSIIGLDALKMMKNFSFAIFVIGSFLVAIPLQFYYNYTNYFLGNIGIENAAGKMTMGQMSEIFFMLLMPFFFVRLGVKYMLLIGMACWMTRYVFFAYGNAGLSVDTDILQVAGSNVSINMSLLMIYLGILLHGICYDFFFVTGQIYVDNKADKSIRGAAQGFIAFATLGMGSFIGAMLSGQVEKWNTVEGKIDWHNFWLVPAIGAAAVMILFAFTFFDKSKAASGQSLDE